jgi:hypothetical protein
METVQPGHGTLWNVAPMLKESPGSTVACQPGSPPHEVLAAGTEPSSPLPPAMYSLIPEAAGQLICRVAEDTFL